MLKMDKLTAKIDKSEENDLTVVLVGAALVLLVIAVAAPQNVKTFIAAYVLLP